MEAIARLQQAAAQAFAAIAAADATAQIVVLVLSTAVAFLLRARWSRRIDALLVTQSGHGFRSLSLRGSRRLVFPISLALMALITRAVFGELGLATGLLDLAVPLMVVLATVRTLVFLLRVSAGTDVQLGGWELFISILLWGGGVLYLAGWLPLVMQVLDAVGFSVGGVRISLLGIVEFVVLVTLLLLASLATARLIENRFGLKSDMDDGVRVGVAKVVKYGLITVAVLFALTSAGLDLTHLAVLGGALGVGIGFGLQKVTSNLISGFLLLFDRSIRPGDVITIDDRFGWVEKMGARYIVVRDRNGVDTLIPNEELITSHVINWSYGDRRVRIKLPVQISYGDDPEAAMALISQAAEASERVIRNPPPASRLLGFGANGIDLELRVWIEDPEKGVNNVRTEINLAIWKAFRDHGVTIPFPQRDLYIKEQPEQTAKDEQRIDPATTASSRSAEGRKNRF